MSTLNKALLARQNVRSYANAPVQVDEEPVGTQDHHDEAAGLTLAAMHLAADYGHDLTNPDFLDHLDALNGHDDEAQINRGVGQDAQARRSFAGTPPRPGMVLQASKTNPKVRRWIRATAQKSLKDATRRFITTASAAHVGRVVGHNGGRMAALATVGKFIGGEKAWHIGSKAGEVLGAMAGSAAINGLYQAHRREHKLSDNVAGSSMSYMHYLKHHGDYVRQVAQHHKVSENAVAHALAYHAISEHYKQRRTIGSSVWKGGSNDEYHKQIGHKAVADFGNHIGMQSVSKKG